MPDGIEVITFLEGNKARALEIISDILGGNLKEVTRAEIQRVQQQAQKAREKPLSNEEVGKRKEKLNKLLKKSQPARRSELVQAYLRSRGLDGNPFLIPDSLGFAKALWYGDENTSKPMKLSGMLGMMTDVHGKKVTIHRTFLNPVTGHKADVLHPKLLMAPPKYIGGCSIKLDCPMHTPGGWLITLCEGIETGMAVREATGMPVWSCYSNTLLEMVNLPDYITYVVIWADKDQSGKGQESAFKLAETLKRKGKIVQVKIPQEEIPENAKSVDWLDVYRAARCSGTS